MDALNDLAIMLRRVAHSLPMGHPQRERITTLLTKHGLQGSPLRDAATPAPTADDRGTLIATMVYPAGGGDAKVERAAPAADADLATAVIRDIAELDNPSHPDWPEALIIAADELRVILERHFAAQAQEIARLKAELGKMIETTVTWQGELARAELKEPSRAKL